MKPDTERDILMRKGVDRHRVLILLDDFAQSFPDLMGDSQSHTYPKDATLHGEPLTIKSFGTPLKFTRTMDTIIVELA